ncbi:MAG: ribose 5-phosphate isomerase B [Sphingomonas sp.]|uniref:ribose 5-phosphate isomerase B n=1 Tax=Sphingomonas sp. TaxID=28214 RepID=UPI0025E4F25E|nr:ribose 5-phosphate isomerase B [Sphingomonas sp.]MBX9881563.1 ribose 5-phosphate isomerase B [Sphingomonas sp.]
MQLAIASDHAGYPLKAALVPWLEAAGHDVLDLGTNGTASVDYPDFGRALAEAVASGRAERGIAVCGSGIGISIAVNRHPALRCARVDDPLSATLARQHNDANAVAFGARLIGEEMARAILTAFLSAEFEGGRHQHRVDKLGAPQETLA